MNSNGRNPDDFRGENRGDWFDEEDSGPLVSLDNLTPASSQFTPPPRQGARRQGSRQGPAQRPSRSQGRASVPADDYADSDYDWFDDDPYGDDAYIDSSRPQRRPGGPVGQGRAPRDGRQAWQRREQMLQHMSQQRSVDAVVKPQTGWRAAVLRMSGGVVNVGISAAERQEQELRRLTRRPVVNGTVGVFSRKGGVGKTTISAYLGLTLAAERGGRIVTLDGDSEAGSLGWLLAPRAPSTLSALASADPLPTDYAGLRRFTSTTPEGLEVIVGDPAEAGPISVTGLEAVARQLSRHYDLSIFDTGAGVTKATGRVLVNSARVLLLVMGPSIDSVRAAERTLAWLDERPGEAADPHAQVIAVINGIPQNIKAAHIERIEELFIDRCDAVVRIPWDAHLAAGSTSVSLDLLAKSTRRALLELAATTVSAVARPSRRQSGGGARGAQRGPANARVANSGARRGY